jgi:uncharacterized protein YbjT (DUF2867 family)
VISESCGTARRYVPPEAAGAMTILIFGATGSAGGSVLRACLAAPFVREVRTITRRRVPLHHDKLQAIVHDNYSAYAGVAEAFADVDACLFCLGISVTQVSGEAEYRRITYDYAVTAARALHARSPGAAFHFISGRGTGLHSRFMWARVKAETERALMELVEGVCWRPAAIDGIPSDNAPRIYGLIRPLFRVLKPIRSLYIDGESLGRAMLQATTEKMHARVIENSEIRAIAERAAW